jgi:hypothetical protein
MSRAYPASDLERWIDSENAIGHRNVPRSTAALNLARVRQRGFYHDLQAGRRVKKED